MKRLRVYADTSVLGGCFDDEFAEFSLALLDMVQWSEIVLLISDLLVSEIVDAPAQVKNVFESLPAAGIELILSGPESEQLRDNYPPRWSAVRAGRRASRCPRCRRPGGHDSQLELQAHRPLREDARIQCS
jgi:hypothetical protein